MHKYGNAAGTEFTQTAILSAISQEKKHRSLNTNMACFGELLRYQTQQTPRINWLRLHFCWGVCIFHVFFFFFILENGARL